MMLDTRYRALAGWIAAFSMCILLACIATPGLAKDLQTVRLENGMELAVQRNGSGPTPIAFIHGYSLSLMTWDKVAPLFPADKYTTYAYDLRGFGDSSKPPSGFNYRQHTEDLRELLKVLKLTRAVIIGHSIGGQIAQEFVIRYPNEAHVVLRTAEWAKPRWGLVTGASERVTNRRTC
jgi:pimeloyl-ACP methyl ester carboxylesterase